MLLRKNWFSYMLWFLYTILFAYLSTVFVYATGVGIFKWNAKVSIGVVAVFFLLTAGTYFGVRKLLIIRNQKWKKKISKAYAWENFFWVMICLSAIIYRFYLLYTYSTGMTQEDVFYRVAMTRGGFLTPFLLHGATEIYTYFLYVLFSIFGVNLFLGVTAQAFFQIIAMILFFAAIKIYAGRIAAFAVLLYLSFSSFSIRSMYNLSPTAFYMMLYGLVLLLIATYLNKERKIGSVGKGLVVPILLGIFIGFLFYLDILGITLLIFGALIFDVKWKRIEALSPEERIPQEKRERKKSFLQFLTMIGSFLCGTIVIAFLDSFRQGMNIISLFTQLGIEYGKRSNVQFNFIGVTPLFGTIFCFIAMFYVFGFWTHKRQKASPWIFLFLCVCGIRLFRISLIDYNYILAVSIAVFAGLGIKSISPDLYLSPTCGIKDDTMTGGDHSEPHDKQQEVCQEAMVVVLEEQIEMKEDIGMIPEVEVQNFEDMELEETSGVTMIHNPLPLPKKHEKKIMNFDIDNMMDDFDLISNEEDDFDH